MRQQCVRPVFACPIDVAVGVLLSCRTTEKYKNTQNEQYNQIDAAAVDLLAVPSLVFARHTDVVGVFALHSSLYKTFSSSRLVLSRRTAEK